MEVRVFFLLGVFTTCLVHLVDNTPEDPRAFRFLPGAQPVVDIQESSGCLSPNVSSTKFLVKLQTITRIGLQLKTLYVLCYDKYSKVPLVSQHHAAPKSSQVSFKTSLSNDKFTKNLTTSPSQFYDCSYQVSYFNNAFGPQTYIGCNAGTYFSPTNLVPPSDFPFEQEKKATQYFINTFPQWERIKIGNWKNLEDSIQNYVNMLDRPLEVTSGTLGVTTILDREQRKKPIYLTTKKGDTPTVPAPKLVWKMLYDSQRVETIVFVIVNNPYRYNDQDLFRNGEIICICVCDQTEGWFKGWNRKDYSKGYIYCCTGEEFRRKVGADAIISAKLMRRKGP